MTPRLPLSLRRMAPSLVTIAALCAGMSALRMDIEGHLETALTLLLLAMVLDAVDGKLARWLDTASPFGAELDSLSDFFNFGIVPGVIIYNNLYAGTDYATLGWIACLTIAICCALRLARFNLARKSGASDDVFLGVPAPALACLALMPVFLHLCAWDTPAHPLLRTAYIIGVGLLAISTIPTISIKHVGLRSSLSLPVAILGALGVYGLITNPWPTLVALNCLYLGLLPLFYMKLSRSPKSLAQDMAPSAE